jgi:transcription elongation factor GreA
MSMSYLGQFNKHLSNHDYPSFLSLWEEYCMGDEIDGEELKRALLSVKESEFSKPFGRHVENALPLWETIKETPIGHEVIKLIFDLQTTNTPELGNLAFDYLKTKYPSDSNFNDKIRLVGLREMQLFQGAISNYELLSHMKKGNFVFHTGGWGVGEIMDLSFVREQLSIEFDYVGGTKDLSFENAFKNLIPIPDDHFLALRFGNPDELEERAKKNPVEVIHCLLRDLGPSTAAEIKDELCELVIPTDEWARWWQTARSKIKKDTLVETPNTIREPFKLRESEVSHEDTLHKALEKKPDPQTFIQIVYTFLRDFPKTIKNEKFRKNLEEKLKAALSSSELSDAQELQLHFFLQDLQEGQEYSPAKELITRFTSPEDVIKDIGIITFKKRVLIELRKLRQDWQECFLKLLLEVDQNPLRDYILSELLKDKKEKEVSEKLQELLAFPSRHPQVLIWYFQKIMKSSSIPMSDTDGKCRFFEALLILLSHVEQSQEDRDVVKKILTILTTQRYSTVRKLFKDASIEVIKEFLLLATKCQSLTEHDIKIFHSLAEVVHPSLAKLGKKYDKESEDDDNVIWTTQEGYRKIKDRIKEISTVETVENAKEIEAARALGDLRENAEFKAALERRDRLQGELRTLSEQFNRARILTENDIAADVVGVGAVIDLLGGDGKQSTYTLLGPWEADPEKHILSFQSKLAQSLMGKKVGDEVSIKGQTYKISNLRKYFETL